MQVASWMYFRAASGPLDNYWVVGWSLFSACHPHFDCFLQVLPVPRLILQTPSIFLWGMTTNIAKGLIINQGVACLCQIKSSNRNFGKLLAIPISTSKSTTTGVGLRADHWRCHQRLCWVMIRKYPINTPTIWNLVLWWLKSRICLTSRKRRSRARIWL